LGTEKAGSPLDAVTSHCLPHRSHCGFTLLVA